MEILESNQGVRRPTLHRSENWGLHRQGVQDEARHQEKIEEAIRGDLAGAVSSEAILSSDGNKIVTIPVRSFELPKFRFDDSKRDQIGQGDGSDKSGIGDVIGKAEEAGSGQGQGAGDGPGVEYIEAEITVDRLAQIVFEDLGLPDLQSKKDQEIDSEAVKYEDIRKNGIMSLLDKKRTMLANIRRNALHGKEAKVDGINTEDLRYLTWDIEPEKESNAVIIAMRDNSGSMGEYEAYIARSFFFWMDKFLQEKYDHVQTIFIVHSTTAKEVDKDTFFRLGESGGTKVSSAYELALKVIKERFHPEKFNIYPFHISDGDNWGDDSETCLNAFNQLLAVSNRMGYGEVRRFPSSPSLMNTFFSEIEDKRFIPIILDSARDVYAGLKRFFPKEKALVR